MDGYDNYSKGDLDLLRWEASVLGVSFVALLGVKSLCPEVVGGWVWYCDTHLSWGVSDYEGEARHLARRHFEFWADKDDGECDIVVIQRIPKEKATHDR